MNRNELRTIRLDLLVVFEALMLERSVSAAADRVHLGQPAVHASLNRMRILYGDPLLLREGPLLVPTPRAIEIASFLTPALNAISEAISPPTPFDSSLSRSVFRLGLSDDVELALLPKLLNILRAQAPLSSTVILPSNFLKLPALIRSGEISLGIGYTQDLPGTFKRKVLRRSRTMLLRADPSKGEMTWDEYCRRPHVLVSFAGGTVGFVDRALSKLGRERRVVLTLPNFGGLGAMLSNSDLVASVPDYVAHAIAAASGLRAESLPIDVGQFEISMVWHPSADSDPGQKWLRTKIEALWGEKSNGMF